MSLLQDTKAIEKKVDMFSCDIIIVPEVLRWPGQGGRGRNPRHQSKKHMFDRCA